MLVHNFITKIVHNFMQISLAKEKCSSRNNRNIFSQQLKWMKLLRVGIKTIYIYIYTTAQKMILHDV